MHRNYFYTVLGLTVFSFLLIVVFFFGKPAKEMSEKNMQTVQPPFPAYINGVGIVEPKSGNIYIGIPYNRIIKKIAVSVNDPVKKGEVLVILDHDDLIANLGIKQKEYEKAVANVEKLKALPRAEDLIIAQTSLKKAQEALQEAKSQYEMVSDLPSPRAISKEEQDRRRFKVAQAEADLLDIEAKYEKIKGGTWQPDLKIATYQVDQAKADLEAIRTEIRRMSIKSPMDGTVLQIKIHEGETPSLDPSQKSAIVIGNIDELHLRVNVDQLNLAKLTPNAPAVAFRQGDLSKEFPLEFIHTEPLMIPKKYLTNSLDEQVDTQVFQILYRIAKKNPGLFIGEQMDVFIDKKK